MMLSKQRGRLIAFANALTPNRKGVPNRPAGRSQNIFIIENEHVHLALDHALSARVHLFIGHGKAGKIRRG